MGRAPRNRRSGARGATGQRPATTSGVLNLRPAYGPTVRIARGLEVPLIAGATDKSYWNNFSLADVPSSNEFTALFLEWRLDRVEADLTWNPSTATGALPRVLFAMDPTSLSLTSVTDALQRGYRLWSPNPTRNTLTIRFQPKVCALVASSPGSGATVNNAFAPAGTWFSTTQPSTGYNALMMWIENFNTGNTASGTFSIFYRYYFAFRGTK